jgi:hypothetical protein
MMMVPDITLEEYFMGRDKVYPEELSDAHKANAVNTVSKVNTFLERFGSVRRCVSGWRPNVINAATKGAAPHSKHVLCQAIDLEDVNRELTGWIMNNQDFLVEAGFWMENPTSTPTWVHLQTVPPGSGKRIFNP